METQVHKQNIIPSNYVSQSCVLLAQSFHSAWLYVARIRIYVCECVCGSGMCDVRSHTEAWSSEQDFTARTHSRPEALGEEGEVVMLLILHRRPSAVKLGVVSISTDQALQHGKAVWDLKHHLTKALLCWLKQPIAVV